MNANDLRKLSSADLDKEIKDQQKTHFNLRMQLATQQLSNTAQLKSTRRAIARAKTVRAQQSSMKV